MMRVESGVVGLADGYIPIPTRLHYDALNNPYAVRAVFVQPGCAPVEWMFSRDLLIEGLSLPSGLMDVKIRPEFNHIWLMLGSGEKAAAFKFSRSDIQDFVNRITALVPREKEHELVNWDEELKVFEE